MNLWAQFGEPVWTAEDEQTECFLSCFFDKNTHIYIVLVEKGPEKMTEYFPAFETPKNEMSERDRMIALQKAVSMADKIVAKKDKK